MVWMMTRVINRLHRISWICFKKNENIKTKKKNIPKSWKYPLQGWKSISCSSFYHPTPSLSAQRPEPNFGFQLPLHTSSVHGWGVQQRSSVLPDITGAQKNMVEVVIVGKAGKNGGICYTSTMKKSRPITTPKLRAWQRLPIFRFPKFRQELVRRILTEPGTCNSYESSWLNQQFLTFKRHDDGKKIGKNIIHIK